MEFITHCNPEGQTFRFPQTFSNFVETAQVQYECAKCGLDFEALCQAFDGDVFYEE